MKKLVLLLAAVALPALAKPPAPPPAPTFGVSGPWTKIADAGWGNDPTYGDGHNIVASGNEIYVAFSSDDTYWSTDLYIWVARSLDGGVTWEHNALVAHSPTVEWNGAGLAIGPDPTNPGGRRLHVVWGDIAPGSDGNANIMYSYAPLDPQLGAFSAPVALNGAIQAAAYSRNIAADPLGGVHVVFGGWDPTTYTGGNYYSRSADGGTTFAEVATYFGTDGNYPAIAADAAGDVFVAHKVYPAVAYYRRLAGEAAFRGPVIISGIFDDEPNVAAFDANHVYISGSVSGGSGVASTANGGLNPSDWTVHQVTTTSAWSPKVACDATGAVGLAWLTTGPVVYFSRSMNGGATWSTPGAAFTFRGGDDVRDVNLTFDASGKALLDIARNSTIAFTKEK